MGAEITLEVGGLAIDYAKGWPGNDHGVLFQERDRKRLRSDQIDYEHFTRTGDDPGPMEMAFSRPLKKVIPRLDLLGFTLAAAARHYEYAAEEWHHWRLELADNNETPLPAPMGFSEFCKFATTHPIQSLDNTSISPAEANSMERLRGRFNDEEVLKRLPRNLDSDDESGYSERSHFGHLIDVLHPYLLLRILAESTENLDADVVWQYGPMVADGDVGADYFVPGAGRAHTFLIATEGSSDVHVLKHGFALIKPEVADFFKFIDVSERHPFSGASNLVKFAEGLMKIDVQNQILFVLDNDAEGYEAHQRILKLGLPPNMRAMMLPELEQFRSFPTRGPDGTRNADINRRAAAIECYLDLSLKDRPPAQVIWTNYKKDLDVYHGALEHKETYLKHFLDQTAGSRSDSYDLSNISIVLDAISAECCRIATGK
jgi:hypothetical protein